MRQLAVLLVIHTADEPQAVEAWLQSLRKRSMHDRRGSRALNDFSDHGLLVGCLIQPTKGQLFVEANKTWDGPGPQPQSRIGSVTGGNFLGREFDSPDMVFHLFVGALKADQQCEIVRWIRAKVGSCSRKGALGGLRIVNRR